MQFLNSIALYIYSNTDGTMVKQERCTVFNTSFATTTLLKNIILAPWYRDCIGVVATP
jgi:hypothetical protein